MADNTSIVGSLFGTPEMYDQARREQFASQAAQLSQLNPSALANFYAMQTGFGAGDQVAGALGVQDPMMQQISQQQQLLSGVDFTNVQSLAEAARQATAMGRPDIAQQLAKQAIDIQSKIDEKQAAREQALAIARERNAAVLEAARERSNATIEAAKERGATQTQIAAMQIEARKELANLAAALKQGQQAAKPLSTKDIEMANELSAAVKDSEYGINEAKRFTEMIDKGTVKFGAVENLATKARSFAGQATPSDVAKSDLEKWITSSINAVLNQAKGVQAKDDAERAQRQIMEALDKNDPKLVKNGIARIQKLLENTKENATSGLELLGQERNRDLAGRVTTPAAPAAETGGWSIKRK